MLSYLHGFIPMLIVNFKALHMYAHKLYVNPTPLETGSQTLNVN